MKNVTKLILFALSVIMSVSLFSLSASAYIASDASDCSDNETIIYENFEHSDSNYPGTDSISAASSEICLSSTGTLSGSLLTDFEKVICIELKDKVALVANGSLSSAEFSITSDLSALSWTKDELGCVIRTNGSFTTEAKNALKAKLMESANTSSILYSLVTDCPYELFWFDKVTGISCAYTFRGNDSQMYITSLTYSFAVSEDYRYSSSSTYKVSSTKIAQANSVISNIEAIVEKHANKSDLEKLEAYRDEICSLVDYNFDAVENDYVYGNPWQLIHVFDNDSSTKVVCEGYAKAFKYLCDLSVFDKDIYCYLVSGYAGEGHMWNVVSINGNNYLVDVTNCDGGLEVLFLAGGTSSDSGMTHIIANLFTYTYYNKQYNLHCDGYLILSETSYHEHRYSTEWLSDGTYHWHECSCGEKTDCSAHVPTNSATCSQKTLCSVCETEYGSLLSHVYNQEVANSTYLKSAATCTSKAAYYYSCSCGAKGTETFEYGDVLSHSYTLQSTNAQYLKSAATCTSKAVYYYSCSCGEKSVETFEYGTTLSHSYTVQNVNSEYLKQTATCSLQAVYYYSCTCGQKGANTFKYGELAPHTYKYQNIKDDYLKSAATCTSRPVYYYSCVCGAMGTTTFEYGPKLAHDYTVENVSNSYLKSAATCTAKSVYYYSCTCGAKGAETFEYGDVLSHSYTLQSTNVQYLKSAATCTAKAVYYYSCSCGAKGTNTFSYGATASHTYGTTWLSDGTYHWHECSCGEKSDVAVHTSSTPATTTQKAVCSVCKSEFGDLLTHTFDQKITTDAYLKSPATCTSKAVYYYSCSCGEKSVETFEHGTTLSHSYTSQNIDGDYLKSAATCTSRPVYYYSCVCGAMGTTTFEYGPKLAHDYTVENVSNSYLKSAATCTSKAVYYYSCSCGAKGTETFEYGDVLSHSYTLQSTNVQYLKSAATCTAKAVYYYSCSCGAKGTNTFNYGATASHTYGTTWLSDGTYHWHECSCGEKSDVAVHTSSTPATTTQKAVCSVCKSEFGDLLTHTFDQKITTDAYLKSPATCTSKAVYYYSCSCGEKSVETFEHGTTLSHSYTVQIVDDSYLKSLATCTDEAEYYYSCACGMIGTSTFKVGNPLGHNYDALGVCNTCGFVLETEPPEKDNDSSKNDDNSDIDEPAVGPSFPDKDDLPNVEDDDTSSDGQDEVIEKDSASGENRIPEDEEPQKQKSFWTILAEFFMSIIKFLFGVGKI